MMDRTATLSSTWTRIRWAGALAMIPIAWAGGESALILTAALGILTVGLAHGAIDPALDHRFRFRTFIVVYLAAMAVVALGWWLAPGLSLLVFLLASAWHFGEGDGHHHEGFGPTWSRGAFVVLAPLGFRAHEAAPVVMALTQEARILPAALVATIASWSEAMPHAPVVVALIALGAHLATVSHRPAAVVDALVLGAAFACLPLFVSFGLYFCGWHALHHLRAVHARIPLRRWVTVGGVFTSMTWIILIGGYVLWRGSASPSPLPFASGLAARSVVPWRTDPTAWSATHWAGLFGFLSVVTIPHILIVGRAGLHRDRRRR
ncbi:MAG: Brp/Blh family beta-carotene 15,15'-dioxygenase, partial [Myxococcota bacterium]